MKILRYLPCSLASLVVSFALVSCKDDDVQNEKVVITPDSIQVLEVTKTTAALRTSFSLNQEVALLNDYGIVYGTSPDPTTLNSIVSSCVEAGKERPFESGAIAFRDTLRDLDPATTYYARCYVEDEKGEVVYGKAALVKTPDPDESVVITPNAIQLISTVQTMAVLETSFSISEGSVHLNDYGIVYGISPVPTVLNSSVSSNVESGTDKPFESTGKMFRDTLRELGPETAYYARCYVENKKGEFIYGPTINFKTADGHQWASLSMKEYPGMICGGQAKALVSSSIYVIGGIKLYTEDVQSKASYKYDIEEDAWTQLPDFPGPCWQIMSAIVVEKQIYVINAHSKQVWEFDTDANVWTRKADFPSNAEQLLKGVSLNKKIYYGFDLADPYREDWWMFDPSDATDGLDARGNAIGKWTLLPASPGTGGTVRTALFTHNGKSYTYVGDPTNMIYEFDPSDNSWKDKTSFPGEYPANDGGANQDQFAYVIGNMLYFDGGASSDSGVLWTYDLIHDKWESIDTAPSLQWVDSFVYNGNGYLMDYNNVLYRYYP